MQQPIPFDYLLSDYLERWSYKPGDIIRYRERISRTPRHILTGLTYRTKTPIPGSAAQYLMRVEHTPGDRFGNDCRISRIHTIKINRYFTYDKSRDYRKDGLYISIFSVLIPYQQVLISSKEVLILCICSTIIYNLVSERKLSTLQIGISAYI